MLRLIIPFGLLLAVDLYFFQSIRTSAQDLSYRWRMVWNIAFWTTSAITFVALYFSATRENLPNFMRYYLFSGMLVLFIPKLVAILFLLGEDIFRFGRGVIGMFDSVEEPFLSDRRKFISTAGLVAAAIPFTSMLYGMAVTAFSFSVKRKTIEFDDLPPEFDGLQIVQISDLHSGSFASPSFIRSAVDKILDLKPDLIFFTGDLVNNVASEAEPYVEEFSRLKAKHGVYSVLGNHDYGDYGPWPSKEAKDENFSRLKKVHSDSNWNLLLNEHAVIEKNGAQLAVVGVENWGASRHFPKYGDLDKATLGAENVPFKILLSHDPSHWDAQIKDHPQKFQLTLSGHTHGAQFGIEIPGFKWSPAKYMYKQWAGLYQEEGQHIYVNRGLGFIGYMGRVGIPPEITLVELKSKKIA